MTSLLPRMATFAEVAETRSFSAAARRLGVAKSSVSKAVAALEAHLGCTLLHRSTRRVTLTREGEIFLASCRSVLQEAARAEEAVREAHDMPQGLLRVNAPTGFAAQFLAPALGDFLARHPKLEVEIEADDRYVDVVGGGWDVVLRVGRHGRLGDSRLRARRLAQVPAMIVAAPGYLAHAGTPRRPQDLRDHQCILYTLSSPIGVWPFVRRGGGIERVRVHGRLRCNHDAAMLSAALAGLGVVLLPAFSVLEQVRRGELVSLFGGSCTLQLQLFAVMPPSSAPPAKVRAFVDFLVERFSREEWS